MQMYQPCVALGGRGIAMCGADQQWGECNCVVPPAASGVGMMQGGVVMTPACGNQKVEPDKGETCERGMPLPTCADMFGPGATGLVMCDLQCHIDMQMCAAKAPVSTGGTTGAMGGTSGGTAGMGMR